MNWTIIFFKKEILQTGKEINLATLNPLRIFPLHTLDLMNKGSNEIELSKTFLDGNVFGYCYIGLILDPYHLCPDSDRANNNFIYHVLIEPGNKSPEDKCQVYETDSGTTVSLNVVTR